MIKELAFGTRNYYSLDSLVEPPTTVVEDISRWKNDGSMTNGKPDLVRLASGLWVWSFNGSDAVIDVGDVTGGGNTRAIKSALCWIYPDDNTTRSIMDLDGGTHSLELDGSGDLTATGWSTPTRYVNAAVANAVTVSVWSFIAVTTATAFDASDFDIGKEASYFDGYITIVRLYEEQLSASLIMQTFQKERHYFGV